ncbi:MAG: SEC-C domain-containing protein [Mariprofundus sp.]|nr:SEC-C domain-containing protein [Mariprofundus sp.]
MHELQPCPCGSQQDFTNCCQPIIEQDRAQNPETLMRSRYSAYVLGYWEYLHTSWHPDTRPSSVSPTSTDWLGLKVIKSTSHTVEFIAGFKEDSKVMALHEISRFQQIDGHWRYVDGQCDVSEVSRNSLCPCDSQLKTKRCCARAI